MNLDRCPCCNGELKIGLTRHALERLDERLYIKYFRGFRIGEDKQKWLLRASLEAITQGQRFQTLEPDIVMQYWRGVMFVFKDTGGKLLLLTVYARNLPKKRQILTLPAAATEALTNLTIKDS